MSKPIIDNFRPLCTVTADLSTLTMITRESTGPDGRKFWNVDYAIVVSFGLTEFEARLEWVENVSCILLFFFCIVLTICSR